MNADERRLELNLVTEMIIGCAFKVGNTLGVGFLERVYENALVHELGKTALKVEQQTKSRGKACRQKLLIPSAFIRVHLRLHHQWYNPLSAHG